MDLFVFADDVAEWLAADSPSAIASATFHLFPPFVKKGRPLAYLARLLPWQREEPSRPRARTQLPGQQSQYEDYLLSIYSHYLYEQKL